MHEDGSAFANGAVEGYGAAHGFDLGFDQEEAKALARVGGIEALIQAEELLPRHFGVDANAIVFHFQRYQVALY